MASEVDELRRRVEGLEAGLKQLSDAMGKLTEAISQIAKLDKLDATAGGKGGFMELVQTLAALSQGGSSLKGVIDLAKTFHKIYRDGQRDTYRMLMLMFKARKAEDVKKLFGEEEEEEKEE